MENKIYEEAINYAQMACDTIMKKFNAEDLPPKSHFLYHGGVFLSGMLNTYKLCAEEKYAQYIEDWASSMIFPDGSVYFSDRGMLDYIQPAILLFFLYERTGDEKFNLALRNFMEVLRRWPKNNVGGFWHKYEHPNEMWLDGLYMAGPLEAEYAYRYKEPEFLNTAVEQILIMYDNMRDEKTGLLYHAWDCTRKMNWADKETGLSSEVWGRALGWYVVAVLDIMRYMPKEHPKYKKVQTIERELLIDIIRYRDEDSGLWYQVVDKGYRSDNWLETSCSSLFIAAIARAVKTGVLDDSYIQTAIKGFNGIIKRLKTDENGLIIDGICIGTSVNDYEGYISRPTSENDLHGVGAFLLMCTEVAKMFQQ